jgi:uncharacterized protein
MMRRALNSMLYFPDRRLHTTPKDAGLDYTDLEIETEDGERLHGWLVEGTAPTRGHVLLCHGNAGNVSDRVLHAKVLSEAGFDVLLFDYRGYGRSTGSPSEEGTYRDARAARERLEEPAIYVGESLGGAVALELARESPPAGLVLQSTFTSVREMARLHYPFIPAGLVPDAYPSIRLIGDLEAPLLVLHGERDDIVPPSHGRALFDAAPEPKQIRTFPDLGHNDLVPMGGKGYAEGIAAWAGGS